MECYYCHKFGHIKLECLKLNNKQQELGVSSSSKSAGITEDMPDTYIVIAFDDCFNGE